MNAPLLSDKNIQYGVLHNRKTAGTALKEVISQQIERTPLMNVICFEHAMTFPLFVKKYPTAKAIFFVRDPISRFVSGFYSRLRQGKPRYDFPWSKREAKAFARFSTPNQLAEALSSKRFFERYAASSAMRSIRHVRHTFLEFLGNVAYLEKEADKIAFIGHQQDFDADFCKLRRLLKIDNDIDLPKDDVKAHRNPQDLDKELSPKALINLKKWYQADYDIYHWCLEKREGFLQYA